MTKSGFLRSVTTSNCCIGHVTTGMRLLNGKKGFRIEFSPVDLERSDPWDYYTDRHLALTREFVVSTVLEQVGASQLRERADDGKQAFADRLRTAR